MKNQDSILDSTKKLLNIPSDYDVFDLDILTHINSAFSTLHQLGVGPKRNAYFIQDSSNVWSEFTSKNEINSVRTYVYDKVRLAFDPPGNSFGIQAIEKRISEHEWRLLVAEEDLKGRRACLNPTTN